MVTQRRTATESNRCSEAALRTCIPGSHRAGHASPSSRKPEAPLNERSCRRPSGRDASNEDVQTQLVKEHPRSRLDLRVAERPASREQLASRRAARFSHLDGGRVRRLLPARIRGGGLWHSGSVGRSTPCGGSPLPSPDARVDGGTRERPRAPRARSVFAPANVRSRATLTDCLPIEMKPEHARE